MSLNELAIRIRKSSSSRFSWQFYQCSGIDPQSPMHIREALQAIIGKPEHHESLKVSGVRSMTIKKQEKSARVKEKAVAVRAAAKPADLRKALAAAPTAEAAWRDLTPIARRDFMSWIDSAKQAETRQRRIERACENLAAGKRRPCCYAVVPMDLYKALGATPKAKAQWSGLTPTERRDFTDWIESAKERATRRGRVEETCEMLAAGKRCP